MSQQPRRKQKKIRSHQQPIRKQKQIRSQHSQIRRKAIRRKQVRRQPIRSKQERRKWMKSQESHQQLENGSWGTTTKWCGWIIKLRKIVALLISWKFSSSSKNKTKAKAHLWSMSVWCVMEEASGQLIVRSHCSRTGVSHLICHQSLSVHVSCTCMHA